MVLDRYPAMKTAAVTLKVVRICKDTVPTMTEADGSCRYDSKRNDALELERLNNQWV